jgi:hypothetical protein
MSRLQSSSTVIKLVHAVCRLLLDQNDVRDKRHLIGAVEKRENRMLGTEMKSAHDPTRCFQTSNPHPGELV